MCEQTEMTKKKTASPSPQNKNAPKKMNVPNPLIIIVCIILLGALASYIIPAGSFTRVEDPNTGRMVVDPASFSYVDADPTGFFELFMAAAVSSLFCSSSAVPLVSWRRRARSAPEWAPWSAK